MNLKNIIVITFLLSIVFNKNFQDNIKTENIMNHVTELNKIAERYGSRDDLSGGFNQSVMMITNSLKQYSNFFKDPIIQIFSFKGFKIFYIRI
jgi:hypothetical protein